MSPSPDIAAHSAAPDADAIKAELAGRNLTETMERIGASITFYGLAVVRQFEMMGVYCLNGSQAITRSRDKLRALQMLCRHDVGIPPTVLIANARWCARWRPRVAQCCSRR